VIGAVPAARVCLRPEAAAVFPAGDFPVGEASAKEGDSPVVVVAEGDSPAAAAAVAVAVGGSHKIFKNVQP